MSQSRTLSSGMDVHKAAIAVASVSQDHDAEVVSLGTIGTRPGARDQLVRTLQSQATHLVFVVAVTLVAERGDLTRFENPRQLMKYLGLTPQNIPAGSGGGRGR